MRQLETTALGIWPTDTAWDRRIMHPTYWYCVRQAHNAANLPRLLETRDDFISDMSLSSSIACLKRSQTISCRWFSALLFHKRPCDCLQPSQSVFPPWYAHAQSNCWPLSNCVLNQIVQRRSEMWRQFDNVQLLASRDPYATCWGTEARAETRRDEAGDNSPCLLLKFSSIVF